MILRRLVTLLIGLAMALAPLGMPAMAEAASASHHGQSMHQGHCDEQPQPDQHRKSIDKNCCVAMCSAVVAPPGGADLPIFHATRERPASDLQRHGFLGEIATPPPRTV